MIGPKNAATRAVPRLCTANSATRMTMVSGTRSARTPASTSFRPSTADSTEIAGVITESPRNIAAPIMPSSNTSGVRRPSARVASAVSESVPPSPLLSARSRSRTYLSVTTMISAHRISDSTPSTMSRVTGPAPAAAVDRLAEGVERAGADIAVDDADAAERQRPEARSPDAAARRPPGRRRRRGFACDFAHGVGLSALPHRKRRRAYITAAPEATLRKGRRLPA